MQDHTRTTLVLVVIVALCTAAALARPQGEFKPSRPMFSKEPGFFTASDAIFVRPGSGRRDGRSFNSGPVPSQQIEEFKGEVITGPSIGSFESGFGDGDTHVVSGSYNIGTPQGVKQTIIKYKETPGLFAQNSKSKKSSAIGKVIYGRHKDRPLSPAELYIITAARGSEEETSPTKRHADKIFGKQRKFN